MVDVVYFYKYIRSDELKWSVRSLKNIDHRNVYVIGDDPKLDNVIHLPHHPESWVKTRYTDVASKLSLVTDTKEISEDFVLMMDDVFILKPIKLKNYYRGTLEDHLKKRRYNDSYKRMLTSTHRYLIMNGLTTIDFACHTPFIMNKSKARILLEEILPDLKQGREMSIRTLYGNRFKIEADYITRDPKNPPNYRNYRILSTHESTFGNRAGIGQYIRSKLRG